MIWWRTSPSSAPAAPEDGDELRVVVVGDVMLDSDVVGTVSRICPDAPAPVLDVTGRHDRPGGAALAALMIASRPGVSVTLATAAREDSAGHKLSALLRRAAVTVEAVAASSGTRRLTRVRASGASGDTSLVRVDDPGGQALPDTERLGFAARLLTSADVVLVADYGGGVTSLPGVRAALAAVVARGVPVVWDPHPRGAAPVPGVSVVTPNRAEVAGALGVAVAGLDLDRAAVELRERWSVEAVAATDGARGVFAAASGLPFFTPTPFAAAGDTCGAGDRFAGALAVALGSGMSLAEGVAEAVTDVASWLDGGGVAGLSVSASPGGAAAAGSAGSAQGRFTTPSVADRPGDDAELGRATTAPTQAPGSAPTPDPLADVLAVASRVRAAGGRVVATGGCFDVLHAGHVASLEAARKLGDCLVVLINSDDSVRRLKGESRPVHSAADRARVLAGLAAVDAVGVFAEDDPRAALARLRPDIWAKGGDYSAAELPETELLAQWGGRTVLLPYLPGRSTTRILSVGASFAARPAPALHDAEPASSPPAAPPAAIDLTPARAVPNRTEGAA